MSTIAPGPGESPIERPRLVRGLRLQFEDAQQSWVLLYPEGMVKLNPPAAEILRRCDGKADVAMIVADLERTFDTTGLQTEVTGFLALAATQRWIEAAA